MTAFRSVLQCWTTSVKTLSLRLGSSSDKASLTNISLDTEWLPINMQILKSAPMKRTCWKVLGILMTPIKIHHPLSRFRYFQSSSPVLGVRVAHHHNPMEPQYLNTYRQTSILDTLIWLFGDLNIFVLCVVLSMMDYWCSFANIDSP